MAKAIYNTRTDAVDAVFFAVVPDAFMRRDSGFGAPVRRRTGADVQQEHDCPLLAPHDPWSF